MAGPLVTATKAAITIACGGAGYALSQVCAPGTDGKGGLAAGVAIGNALRGVVSNYGKDAGDWLSGRFAGALSHTAGPATNHDLDALAAVAIAGCLEIAAHNSQGVAGTDRFAAALAKAKPGALRDLLRDPAFAEVDDAAVLVLIGGPDGGMGTRSKTEGYWERFVRALAARLDAEEPGGEAVAFVAGWIHRELAAQANEALRGTFGEHGRPYVAVQMLFLRRTLDAVTAGNETTHEMLRRVLDRLEHATPGTLEMVDAAVKEHARIAAEKATAAAETARAILDQLTAHGFTPLIAPNLPPLPVGYVERPGPMALLASAPKGAG